MEDMLKLAPDQIIWLYEHVSGAPGTSGVPEDAHAWLTMSNPIKWLDGKVSKGHFARSDGEIAHGFVEAATADWFENNGETLGETVDFVVEERGGEKEAFRDAVLEGELGVVMGAYV